MKHLRLFLVAVATVFGLSVSAQTWTGNEVAEGTFYLYNVGAQKFLNNGDPNESWGTNAYLQAGFGLDLKFTAQGDGFTLDTNVSNGGDLHFFNSSTWTDGAATPWIFTPIAEGSTVYEISFNNQYLVANDALNDVVLGGKSSTEANNQWMLVSLDDFKAAMRAKQFSSTDPMDVSVFIQGRSFVRNDGRNNTWTTSHNGGNWTWIGEAENKYYGNEAWNQTFNVYQVINDLPAGTYEVRCSGFGTNGSTFIYGNITSKALRTDNTTTYGTDMVAMWKAIHNGEFADNSTGTFTLGEESLTVGLKRENVIDRDWCVYDEFRLQYYGLDLSEFAAALADAVSAAEDLNGQIPSVAYTTLQNVVNENNKTYTTVADYTAATNAILEAIETAKALQKEFGRYLTVKNAILGISSTIDATTSDAQANAATTAEEIGQAVNTIRQALLVYLPNATISEGSYIDLTDALIDNPTVSQNVDYWTVANVSSNGTGPTTNFGETEFYNRNFKFFQTLILNKGTYEFGVTGFHREGNHSTYFYAGNNKTLISGVSKDVVDNMAQAKEYFDSGNGKVALKFALEAESNTIEIGIDNQDTETDKWTIFRNFTLHYFGSAVDLTPYQNAWAEAVSAAQQAITDNPNVTGDELTAVNTAMADVPSATVDSYTEKTNTLVAATQALVAAAPSYNAYAAEKAIAVKIGVTGISDPTTAAAAAAGVNSLKVAEFNYVKDNYPYDYEPVIGTFGEWTGTATVNSEPAEPAYLENEHWSGSSHAYYEQAANGWRSNAWTVQYQKTAKLPAGDYMLKVAARSSENVTGYIRCSAATGDMELPHAGAFTKGIDKDGNASFEGDNFARDGVGFGWEWRFLPFSLTEETEVTMTIYGETNMQYNWMSISDGTLLSKQEISNVVELNGTDAVVVESQVATQVNTDRKLFSGLNTVIFPFETTASELGVATVLKYTGTTPEEGGTTVTLNFEEVAPVDNVITLQANVPYVVVAEADQTENLSFGTKNIAPAEDLTTEDTNRTFDFVGTYINLAKGNDIVKAGDMVAGEKEFKKAAGGNRIAAYRAYLKKVSTTDDVNVAFNFNGEIVNGIEAVEILNRMSGDIYNLNGQKVNRTQKGVYIINGKKVIVK